jgi:restriction system protein
MEILDYSEIVRWSTSAGYSKIDDHIKSLFSKKDNICAYCDIEMKVLHHSWESTGTAFMNWDLISRLFYCCKCGWWHYLRHDDAAIGQNNSHFSSSKPLLKILDSSKSDLPLSVLEQEFNKNSSILAHISPAKMEDFVKYVFEGFYNCEVINCGKSGDGGIDLIIINSDYPIAVQVKRRSDIGVKEKIKNVREFVGALTIKDYRHGIYVTTASDFSKQTFAERSQLLQNRQVEYFELINLDRLTSIFNLAKKNIIKPWEKEMIKFRNINVDVEFNF